MSGSSQRPSTQNIDSILFLRTVGRTDGLTDPHVEMRGRIEKRLDESDCHNGASSETQNLFNMLFLSQGGSSNSRHMGAEAEMRLRKRIKL